MRRFPRTFGERGRSAPSGARAQRGALALPVAALGPLSVSRLPIFRGFVGDFLAMPAHAPLLVSGMVASATPAAPAPLRNFRRSKDRVVLSSFTLSPSRREWTVFRVPRRPRMYSAALVGVKIVANLVAVVSTGYRLART